MNFPTSSRRNVLIGIGAAGIAGLVGSSAAAAQNEEDDQNDMHPDDFAALRIGHLSPDTPTVDAYIGKEPDLNPSLPHVRYPRFAPRPNDGYLQLPPGEYDIYVTPEETTDAAIEVQDLTLEAGARYTALAVGRLDGPGDQPELQPLAIVDAETTDQAVPPEDQAEVSFVHASPDAPPVEITVNGETLLEDVAFGDVSDYVAVDPGHYEIGVQVNGEEVLMVERRLREATRITAYVTGLAGENDELPGLSALTSLDGTYPLASTVITR